VHRRIAAVAGTLAVATALAIALPASAQAAQGSMTLVPWGQDPITYDNPTGCITLPTDFSGEIIDAANSSTTVFYGAGCHGAVQATTVPGLPASVEGANSLRGSS
jgi:hypothetical protein